MQFIAAFLAFFPAISKILENEAVSMALTAFVKLFVKSEAEKTIGRLRENIDERKVIRVKLRKAIKNAKKSKTQELENLRNRY